MAKYSSLLLLCFFLFFKASAQGLKWARSVGDNSWDKGLLITTDDSGNVYTSGTFGGTVDFDPGVPTFNLSAIGSGRSIFVQKLDSTGNFKWAVSIGTLSPENKPHSLRLDKEHN